MSLLVKIRGKAKRKKSIWEEGEEGDLVSRFGFAYPNLISLLNSKALPKSLPSPFS